MRCRKGVSPAGLGHAVFTYHSIIYENPQSVNRIHRGMEDEM